MIWVVLLLGFATTCFSSGTNQTDGTLVFAQIIFRHGDRTIRTSFPNDPYKGKEHWPGGYGQLTNVGKQQEYKLGQFLSRRYKKLLGGGSYSSDKIYTQASEYERTIASATLVLAGLFPPKNNQIWNKDLLWQPIPVYAIPKESDNLINNEVCPHYVKKLHEYENSPKEQAILKRHKELFEYLEKHTGSPVRTLEHVKDLYDILYIEDHANKTLPEWTRKVYPGGALAKLSEYWLDQITGTTELKRLRSGFLLQEIFDRFKNKTLSQLSPVNRVMWLYSGHDSTISSVLNTLGLFKPHIPPYASSLLFELYKSKAGYYVQLFYRNSTTENLEPIEIPNCGTKCSLVQLYNLYSKVLAWDFKAECELRHE